jgi:hypothetical protein
MDMSVHPSFNTGLQLVPPAPNSDDAGSDWRRLNLVLLEPFGTPVLIVDQLIPGGLVLPGVRRSAERKLDLSPNPALPFIIRVSLG